MLHPRDTQNIIGHSKIMEQFLVEAASGRLHHAWIFSGTRGIGKATVAYKCAKALLSFSISQIAVSNSLKCTSQIEKWVHNKTCPDLCVIDSEAEEQGQSTEIKVDQVRDLASFLSTKPVMSEHKVVIIDSIDDLNTNAANALLKTLEEPRPNTYFFLICHQIGRILPTIKSRCRIVKFQPLSFSEFSHMPGLTALSDANLERLYKITNGSVHFALLLSDSKKLALLESIASLSSISELELYKLAADCSANFDYATFGYLLEYVIANHIATVQNAKSDYHIMKKLQGLFRIVHKTLQETEIFNLEKTNAYRTILSEVQSALG